MKCIVNGEEFETIKEICDFVRENITTYDFNDMLDEKYGEIEICGYEFSASYVFICVDNYLYDIEFNDFVNEAVNEIVDVLENVNDNDIVNIYGFTIECIPNEEFKLMKSKSGNYTAFIFCSTEFLNSIFEFEFFVSIFEIDFSILIFIFKIDFVI